MMIPSITIRRFDDPENDHLEFLLTIDGFEERFAYSFLAMKHDEIYEPEKIAGKKRLAYETLIKDWNKFHV